MVIANPRGTAHYTLLGMQFPAAGKTGTAQSGSDRPHAWFIGYTMDEQNTGKPDIAVAVIVENSGEGSEIAAPIFRAILETYYYGSWQSHPRFAAGYGEPTYTPTPFGANPTKTPKPPKGKKQPTPTP